MARKVSLKPTVRKSILAYADRLKARRIPYEQIVVFGSHAKGVEATTSDIDVCVVSDTFGKDYHKSLVSLISASANIEKDLDIVPYTTRDLANRYDPLAKEIRTYGVRVV